MSGWQLFFAPLAILIAIASLLMAFARTPPQDAISNLSKWAEWFGFHRIPPWLLSPQEAFRAAYGCIIQLHVVSDGVEAMAFLRREGAHRGAPTPDLILLDLNLPKISGYEVLTQIKHDDSLKMIPVVVLSSSDAGADVVRSYRLHANCYFKKPAEWDAFYTIVRAIKDFWLSAVDLPSNV